MILGRALLTALLLLGAAGAAAAADRCVSRAEQRARTAAHGVVPLSRAMRAVHAHGEVIQARLCDRGGHLVYLLTVLGRDGKVAQATVDGANGAVIPAHSRDKVEKDSKKASK
jgi:uncharacterized membrane protein YkoI